MKFYSKSLFLDQFTPVSIYSKIKEIFPNEIKFLFESNVNSNSGNYSYIIIGSRERIWHVNDKSYFQNEDKSIKQIDDNPLIYLKKYYKNFDQITFKNEANSLGIGFIDGFIGNIGYDMVKEFEPKLKSHMKNLKDEFNVYDLDLIRPKMVLCFSHKSSKLTIVTSMKDYSHNIITVENILKSNHDYIPFKKAILKDSGKFNFSKEYFFKLVDEAKDMIKSGDIFQILLSNRFTQYGFVDHFSFYRVLRSNNPSPYLFFLEYEDFSIAGSSPEVMVKLTDDKILLRPIAGARKRGKTLSKDIFFEKEMLNDEKEKAEHLMLVDLGRNDLSRVALDSSVKVTDFMRVERYSHVMHMVSDVEATLDTKYDMFDLFMSTFTAGTMTGTPKIRAMELIAKFEKLKRGFYSGSICYFGFDGNMDSAITIRTTYLTKDKVIFQAGAGIVIDSKKELEYLEINNKLAANIKSLNDMV